MTNALNRRQFIQLGTGSVVVVGLGACDRRTSSRAVSEAVPTSTDVVGSTATAPTFDATSPPPTASAAPLPVGAAFGGRRLVVVQLNGGNDLLNALPPADGLYHDLRPTLAIPDADIVALAGVDDAGLHPSLAGLARFWDCLLYTSDAADE